jgi:hypothetical protein
MPLTAIQSSNPIIKLVPDDMESRAISRTGQELLESLRGSINELFRLEVLRYALPFTVGVISTSRKPLRDTLTKIHNLLSWGPNWNSYDALAPDPAAVEHAKSWIVSLFRMVEDLGMLWIKPNTTASPEGEVAFEWRHEGKKLTVYVGDASVDYMQVWGTDIHAKITDGDIESIDDLQALWVWLVS